MTGSIGAGLAPARAARAIQPGDRIHVVGIAGAGASAAAILAVARRRDRDRLRPGRSVAVHRGRRGGRDPDRVGARRRARARRARAGPPGGHEGPHRHRPGPSRARRRARGRHPGRVVAAGHRGCGARPHADRRRGHARQEHHVGLAGSRAGVGRRGSIGVRRGVAAPPASRVACRRRPDRAPATRSSSRRTSTPATSMPTGRTSRSSPRPSGTTRTSFADGDAVIAAFHGLAATTRRSGRSSSPTSATRGVRRRASIAWDRGPARPSGMP